MKADSVQFLGVVRAISREVEKEQRLERGDLFGAAYIMCRRRLSHFDPAQNSSFARYAYQHVKPSLTRDTARYRRMNQGLKTDGAERPAREPPPDFADFDMPVEDQPPWWGMLSRRQRSIVLLISQEVPITKIARWMEITPEAAKASLDQVREALIANQVPPSEWRLDAGEYDPDYPGNEEDR